MTKRCFQTSKSRTPNALGGANAFALEINNSARTLAILETLDSSQFRNSPSSSNALGISKTSKIVRALQITSPPKHLEDGQAVLLNPKTVYTIVRGRILCDSDSERTAEVVIGSGPAAHTAAVYLARAELKPVLYEGFLANGIAAGGQLTTTTDDAMRKQSEKFGTQIITETVAKVDLSKRPFKYWNEYAEDQEPNTADAIIIATGASARRLGLPGEDKYWQNGISACAVCDGAVPIFRNKPLVVIGGGDSAAEEAMFLTKYGSHVTVLVRKDHLRASKTMANRLLANKKVTVKFNSEGAEVKGDDRGLMSHMVIKDSKSGSLETIEANGLFYAVGHDPATALFKGQIETDEEGYVVTKPGTSYTNIEGVFAAGDVQDKRYRQAITSAGSGCVAALEAEKFLAELEDVENPLEAEKDAEKGNSVVVPEYRSNPLL
ncbi:hypothetical protein B2J93_4026 [Marssonina coronariae]|uniref:thioredoxin-disulfide reductase (NADPH) n=1 Tax=Diplocarpon coronariae TaxID=2795749 RepID=A0A218ZAJ3_9HELO|nr:hypothetical protein B2J93_4026 [Marssonina coronariae]